MGKPIKPQKINPVIILHIAKCLNLDSLSDLSTYPSTTRRNHIDKVREYLGINTNIKERRKYVKNSALFAAETKENLADIINSIIEEIFKLKFELPGYTQLLRIARAARKVKNYNYYHHLVADLSQEQKEKLDDLLYAKSNDNDNREISSWIRLKQHLEKPTLKKVRRYLQHLEKLCTLRDEFSIDIHRISPMRIDSLNDEAMAADASMMQQMNETKRYALMVILIHTKTAKTVDELVHAFINWNKKLHSQAKNKLERHRIDSAPNTDELMQLLYNMLLGLKNNESKIKDYPSRFTSTSFSYGCNVGPTQGQRCLQKYTRKQIAWLFNHHINEQKIDKAIYELINRYNLFTLPGKWGDGSSASVDGTFWDMYTQNLLAAHHIRYGKYGGVGYYHVSDKYIALFSNLISCGAHEAAYLLDFIVENDSDIKPTKIHGDSWAQSEVLFGLSAFFNIDVMPRIKNFKHLYFYKASKNDRYFHIDDLFT